MTWPSFEERVDAWTERDPTTGCRLWFGAVNRKGYGRITICEGGVFWATTVHRAVWADAHGPITSADFVLHRCDTPACCNMAHLYLGTHADNMADRSARNRQARGERVGTAKLSDSQVAEVRRLFVAGRPRLRLAEDFEVSPTLIRVIVRGAYRAGASAERAA